MEICDWHELYPNSFYFQETSQVTANLKVLPLGATIPSGRHTLFKLLNKLELWLDSEVRPQTTSKTLDRIPCLQTIISMIRFICSWMAERFSLITYCTAAISSLCQLQEHLCCLSIFSDRCCLHHFLEICQQVTGSHQPIPNLHPCPRPGLCTGPVLLWSHVDGLVLLQLRPRAKGVAAAATAVQKHTGPIVCAQVNLRPDGPRCTHVTSRRGEGELGEKARGLARRSGRKKHFLHSHPDPLTSFLAHESHHVCQHGGCHFLSPHYHFHYAIFFPCLLNPLPFLPSCAVVGVRVLVQGQIGRMREAPSALIADVGPLTRVYPHVLPQVGGLREGFVTHRAGIGLEPEVDILVSPQTTWVLESLGAGVTGVWTLSSVLPQMILIMRTPFEGQRAIGAQKGAHSSVDTLMDLDLDQNRHFKIFSLTTSSFSKQKSDICNLNISPVAERSV